MKWLSLALLLTIFLSSCNDDGSGLFRKELLLKSIHKDGVLNQEYQYDNDNRVLRGRFYDDDGELNSTRLYTYVDDSLIVEVLNADDEIYTIHKYYWLNGGSVGRRSVFDRDNQLVLYDEYDNFENCGYGEYSSYTPSGNLRFSYIFNYTDDDCGYILEDNNLSTDIKSTYRSDGKRYFAESSSLKNFFVDKESLHNFTGFELTINNNRQDEVSYVSSFEYNRSNYPTSEERKFYDGESTSYTYEYY